MKKKKKEVLPKIVMNANRYLELLLYITILGAVLRFYQLGFNSLWLDEAVSYTITNTESLSAVWTGAFNDHHAPLFFIIEWIIHFISTSEFWLRVPSALAGTVTIPVIYFLGKELSNENVGLVAALLLAVSPYHIYYSQEARMYAFVVLFVTLAYYLFFKASRSSDGRYWVLMWLSCAAAFYTHFYTGFVIIPLVIGYFLLRDIKNINWFAGGALAAFLLVLPILSSFLNQSGYFIGKVVTWGLNAVAIPFSTLIYFSFQNQIVAAFFFLLFIFGLWLVVKKDRVLAITLSLFLMVPLLCSMVMSGYIPFNVRYHLYLLPLFLVVVSVGIEQLTHIWSNRNGVIAAVFLILLAALITLPPYYSTYSKEDWRGFSSRLQTTTNPGDALVIVPSYMSIPFNYYYSNSTDGTIELGADTVPRLVNATSSKRVFYIVTNDIYAVNPNGDEMRWLQQNAKPLGQSYGIYLFVRG